MMYRFSIILIFLFFATTIVSCRKAIFIAYNIKENPKENSPVQLRYRIKRYSLEKYPHVVTANSGMIYITKYLKSVNNIIVFNSLDEQIELKQTTNCSNDNLTLLYNYENPNVVNKGNLCWDSLNKYLRTIDGEPINIKKGEKYTIFLSWATFAGRLNKELTREWGRTMMLKDIDTNEIQVYYLNMDLKNY